VRGMASSIQQNGDEPSSLATQFFYAFLFEDIKGSRDIADKIVELPKEDIVTSFAHLGWRLWILYDHMLEIDPELETRVRNTYQKWVENEYKKEP
jgi:hypothetical protein